MNTTVFEEAQNIKVRFHIGRGGRRIYRGTDTKDPGGGSL